MNLSPEQKNSLVKLSALTVGVLIAVWLLLINPTRAGVEQKIKMQNALSEKIILKNKIVRTAEAGSTNYQESSARLAAIEDQMVSGDPYLWIIKTLGEFEVPDKVEFSKYDPPKPVDPLLPNKVAYKSVSFTVAGTANYHEFGKFLASLENGYPHISVHRLDIEPVAGLEGPDEKLSFQLELYVLVKPANVVSGSTAPRR